MEVDGTKDKYGKILKNGNTVKALNIVFGCIQFISSIPPAAPPRGISSTPTTGNTSLAKS